MSWSRLHITVEGQTERGFADRALKPHLAGFEIDVRSHVVVTNRKQGRRGGIFNFDAIRSDLSRIMKEDSHKETRFTTMIDLYALPREFPGWKEAQRIRRPYDKVRTLEAALKTALGDMRFVPYIQLHEFEALLYCDLSELQDRISGYSREFDRLRKEVRDISPEEINEGADTAPSKRLVRHIPIYEKSKIRAGAEAACAIGMPSLRSKCPHFDDWISKLEKPTSD